MRFTARQAALKHGYRSGLEDSIALSLEARCVAFAYESMIIDWVQPEQKRKYTPDFVITTDSGKRIIVESKGRWIREDRLKMKAVVEQNPDLDIRMVFQNPNAKISKGSKTTYAIWCQKYLGIPWAKGDVPNSWILE